MNALAQSIQGDIKEVPAPAEVYQPVAIAKNAAPAVSEGDAFLMMIERAARDPSVDINRFEQLMTMRWRIDERMARKEFDAAISAAKAQIMPVVKNSVGHNNKRYADFSAIALAVDPILAAHGLAYRFTTRQTDKIYVTCIMSHSSGHREETTLVGAADTSGSKNHIQALGSTLTYLQRYSLIQMLGLASTNDDDGKSACGNAPAPITSEQVETLVKRIEQVGANQKIFCEYFKIACLQDMPSSDFSKALQALGQKEARNAANS